MKKKVLLRSLIGGLGGLAISMLVGISISISIGDGQFHAGPPALIAQCGTELMAVIAQMLCSILYGAAMAGSSAIWEVENWSLLRQTMTHMVVISLSALPITYLMHWVPHTVLAVVAYFIGFFLIYFVIWVICYLCMRKKIRKMNENLN